MFHVTIKDTYDEVSKEAFKIMKSVLDGDHTPVLGLATGSSPVGLYQEMIKDHKENGTSYKDILTFNLDEYIGLPRDHRESYWTFMHQNLFNYIDIPDENVHVPLGCGEDPEADCKAYEDELSRHIVDVQVLGIGSDGHIAFNEPGSSLSSRTRKKELTTDTIIANSRFFNNDINQVPKTALTVGVGTVMDAKEVLIMVNGHNKARALQHAIEEPISHMWTVSALQMHQHGIIVCDEAACDELKVGTFNYFKDIEKNNLDPATLL